MKAIEVIPIILIIKYKFIKDEETKKNFDKLVDELIPEAAEDFYERFGLIDKDRLIGGS